MKAIKIPKGTFSPDPIEDLKARLEIGIVEFAYNISTDKASLPKGSIRHAVGTRNLAMPFIDFNDIPMGVVTPPPHILTYFDIDRDKWRCFRKNSLVIYTDIVIVDD